MDIEKRIALVAHDGLKNTLIAWCQRHIGTLENHQLLATGTTGHLLEQQLGLPVCKLLSGPFGGDQQIGSRIAENSLDILIFFWDPLDSQPHDADVRALLRVAALWNIPVACNEASADFLIRSPLVAELYQQKRPELAAIMNPAIASSTVTVHTVAGEDDTSRQAASPVRPIERVPRQAAGILNIRQCGPVLADAN